MLRVSPRPLRALFLVTGLAIVSGVGVVGGLGCQTSHSPGFTKLRAEPAPAPASATARPLPEGTAEGVPEHLLHQYADRELAPDAEIRTWDLPTKATRVVVELLVMAARDDASRLHTIMTQQARWGAPDRREYEARGVSDDGRMFLDVLRQASSRFARKLALTCPPIMPPAAQVYVKNGSEPMWCFYGSNDGLDILAFKILLEGGSAKVDYVGMYAERPSRGIARPGGPQPPPMTPMVRRVPRMQNPDMAAALQGGPLADPNSLPSLQIDGAGVIQNGPGQPGTAQPGQPGTAAQPGTAQPGQPGQPGTAQPGTGTTDKGKPVGGTTDATPKKPATPKPATPKPAPTPVPTPTPAPAGPAAPPAP